MSPLTLLIFSQSLGEPIHSLRKPKTLENTHTHTNNNTPQKTNMTKKHPPFESMYFLLKMGIFQPVMLVNSGVYPPIPPLKTTESAAWV